MPMGLNISPLIWPSYINVILDCLQGTKYGEAMMDGLKISPKNGQLFRKELQYIENPRST